MKRELIELLEKMEIGYIESDDTVSKAGHISRSQYEEVAEAILDMITERELWILMKGRENVVVIGNENSAEKVRKEGEFLTRYRARFFKTLE